MAGFVENVSSARERPKRTREARERAPRDTRTRVFWSKNTPTFGPSNEIFGLAADASDAFRGFPRWRVLWRTGSGPASAQNVPEASGNAPLVTPKRAFFVFHGPGHRWRKGDLDGDGNPTVTVTVR